MAKLSGLVTLFLIFLLPSAANAKCIKGNCSNGYGTFLFPNGDKYIGDFLSGKPHGKGILYFANGNKYIGHWMESYREGEGRMVFDEGHEYLGGFHQNKFHGYGKMSYANGDTYEGDWKNDRPNGNGTYRFTNGKRYEGEFVDGRFHGYGTLFYGDGSRYAGNWVNNQKHGPGTHYTSAGKAMREDWASGKKKTPDTQKGSGNPKYARNCNLEYCAAGTGHFTYRDGSLYEGTFRSGSPEGEGTVFYVNGDQYKGGWKEHAPHGRGTMTYTTGREVVARWNLGAIEEKIADRQSVQLPPVQVATHEDVRIWAVIIGVGTYQYMPVLRYTDDDAYQVYAFLKSPEGGALPDEQIRVLIDENATHAKIEQAMQEIYMQADANDVVLFYFSGHGLEGAFLPVDCDGVNNRLEHSRVKELITRSQAKHKLVLADACHSGSLFTEKQPDDVSVTRLYQAFEASSGGLALLLSSKSQEYSLEDGGLRSGIFSYYLIQGLKGYADKDGSKVVTVQELFDYVYRRVTIYTANAQTPVLTGAFDQQMPVAIIRK
jgi:hypothetical protein